MSKFSGFNIIMEKVKESVSDSKEEKESEDKGFHIIPQDDKANCRSTMIKYQLPGVIVFALYLVATLVFFIIDKRIFLFSLAFGVIILPIGIHCLRLLLVFLSNNFDMFGGEIERFNRISKDHSNKKSETNPPHEYLCAIINGVEARLRPNQDRRLSLQCESGQNYFYILRIKHKYISDDEFFFINADPSLAEKKEGFHNPYREGRKWSSKSL